MDSLIFFIIQIGYFILPAIIASISPDLFKDNFSNLNVPVDGGKRMNGRRVLGANKTFKRLITGSIAGIMVAIIQLSLYDFEFFRQLSIYNYTQKTILLGLLMGFGAMIGDFGKSFVKRRLNVEKERWFFFDELDVIVGAMLLVSIIFTPTLEILIYSLIVGATIHGSLNKFFRRAEKSRV